MALLIDEVERLLEGARVPYVKTFNCLGNPQIIATDDEGRELCDVIELFDRFTGRHYLEIMGALSDEEAEEYGEVLAYLPPEEVANRFCWRYLETR